MEDTILRSRQTGRTFFADAKTAETYKKRGTHDMIARQSDGSYQRRMEQEKRESVREVVNQNRKDMENRYESKLRAEYDRSKSTQRDRKVMIFTPR